MNNTNGTNKSSSVAKRVAYGGIVNLLILVSVYFASILPTNKLFFFGLSSIFLAFIVIEFGVKFAILNYLSSVFLLLIMIHNKLTLIPYILFFGYYAIVKYYVERINNLVLEWFIKLSIFNIVMYLIYFIADKLLLSELKIKIPIWIIILIAEGIFIIYDYAFSIGIAYYNNKIRNRII
ncbi:hypothetical protein [Sporosalibacterium faouarense]|uniref:hypothetical protein n=1 Tax=Sporosalibacterium faouarense TaxID=516123 RepID=UPI00192B88DB|nr:hypothetical protein [Sporosalibacterium faouarense]